MITAPEPPSSLPERRPRGSRRGPRTESLGVRLELVTPVLGGAAVPRTIDEVDIVWVPSIRGQLRFWWRALHVQEFSSARELGEAESRLFGRAADERGGRSLLEVRVRVERRGEVDRSDVRLFAGKAGPATPARRLRPLSGAS